MPDEAPPTRAARCPRTGRAIGSAGAPRRREARDTAPVGARARDRRPRQDPVGREGDLLLIEEIERLHIRSLACTHREAGDGAGTAPAEGFSTSLATSLRAHRARALVARAVARRRPRGRARRRGPSDQRALEALAARRGQDLAAEGVLVVTIGGAHGVGRYLRRFGPAGLDLRLAGLCDAGEEGGAAQAQQAGSAPPARAPRWSASASTPASVTSRTS